jgi:hypothetical protein
MLEEVGAAPAESDDAVLHLIGCGVNLKDAGSVLEAGNSDSGRGSTRGFDDIAPGGVGIVRHATPLKQ